MTDWNDDGNNLPAPMSGNALAVRQENLLSVEEARAVQEVQAAMVIAKKFPRDIDAAYTRVMKACQRKSLAERAIYRYPRGGQNVEGPSIRMAEEIARNFGNIDYGIKILERRELESTAMAYCWDLETNTRQTRIFQVRHVRDKKGGGVKLTDERDIYEIVANMGARRLRAVILGVIPADIVEDAVLECKKTRAAEAHKVPLDDRRRKMLVAFDGVGVTQTMLEGYLKHPIVNTTHQELDDLTDIFTAIRDGIGKREDYFEFQRTETPAAVNINDRLKGVQNGNQSARTPSNDSVQSANGGMEGSGQDHGGDRSGELVAGEDLPAETGGAVEQTTPAPTASTDAGPSPTGGTVNGNAGDSSPGFVRPAAPAAHGNVTSQKVSPPVSKPAAGQPAPRGGAQSAAPKQAPQQKASNPQAQQKQTALTPVQSAAGDYKLKFGMNFGKPLSAIKPDELQVLWGQLRTNAAAGEISAPAQEALAALDVWCPAIGIAP